ncbi:MAG: thiamine pyrophosphate-dependent enzyme [Myxococcota bacterium]|nr:thiamine pyrophosphate-dependent enzyme [Myxococcota bacterium]
MARSKSKKQTDSNSHPSYPADNVCPPEELPDDLIRILSPDGKLLGEPLLDDSEILELHRVMVRQRLIDDRMLTLQRQGRIGFYGACTGQEGAVFGCAAALESTDWIVPALREAGALLYRGFPLRDYFNQLLGNIEDVTQGRQMPCHPPGHDHHYITMSSVIANQIPHANGLALAGKLKKDGRVTMCFMGDGATSEGDFHVGLNVASVQQLPIVYVCQNNQWSISVPVGRQTAAATLCDRAEGYNMPGYRVDGNDLLAVHKVASEAVGHARDGGGPSFLECLTYRLGAHTTSDDPSRYRDEKVTERWWELDPLRRTRLYLINKGLWSEEQEEQQQNELDLEIRRIWKEVEVIPQPELRSIFTDVFAEMTPQLEEQAASLERNYAWTKSKGFERTEH